MKNPQSPFHSSNAAHATDTTVYPPPSTLSTTTEPQAKKRKLENGTASADTPVISSNIKFACLPSRVSANQHMTEKVHDIIKKESEELASSVVRDSDLLAHCIY